MLALNCGQLIETFKELLVRLKDLHKRRQADKEFRRFMLDGMGQVQVFVYTTLDATSFVFYRVVQVQDMLSKSPLVRDQFLVQGLNKIR